MRTVTYGAACSLDGFIAGPDGSVDWIHFSSDVQQIMADYWKGVDTILLGRKTWDFTTAAASAGGSEWNVEDGGGPTPSTTRTYVFSRTLKSIDAPGAELVSGDAGDFVLELKRRKGKGICVLGGGELARSLVEVGAIDEVGLNIHPVLLGAGIPLFGPGARRVKLALIDSRTIDGGCVVANYRVVP